jgi:UDP-N-acetylmuramoylalanine--D-glutamate ligase
MNILSCVLVTDEMNMDITKVSKYLGHIKWLPHRLEIIAQTDEITVVEDSKSTSSQSLAAALGSFGTTKNLLLIVGGSDKWDSFEQLGSLFDARVRAVVCIGATKDQFVSLAKTVGIPYLATDSLSDGARWLYTKRQKNDVLMLSPGCASFWLFRDYLDRANQFREVIKNLLK